MIYQIRVNRKIRNIRVYAIKNRIGQRNTAVTKLFMRLFGQSKKEVNQSAMDKLG